MKSVNDQPVWVDESRCKSCNICVEVCPSGTIAMRFDAHSIGGTMIEVIAPESCIGCRDCELHCPDFAIYVADKGFKFAKLTEEAKKRAEFIKNNNFLKPMSEDRIWEN